MQVDASVLQSLISDSIAEGIASAVAPLHQEIGALKERIILTESLVERRGTDSGDGDIEELDEYDDDDDASSDGGGSVLDDDDYYIVIDPKSNPHFGAAAIANEGDYRPRRVDLYGNKSWMVFTKGGTDTGGTLAFALSYAEPLSLFGHAAHKRAEALCEQYGSGEGDPERFLEDLVALRNSLREQYQLTNRLRSLIVQKARALRPGATEYDKQECRFIERVFEENDYRGADMSEEIARLKGRFAKKSNRAELDRLSKRAGGGGGGGGGIASDDDSDSDGGGGGKSRSAKKRAKAKARKQSERAASSERQQQQSSRGGERKQQGDRKQHGDRKQRTEQRTNDRSERRGGGGGSTKREERQRGSGAGDDRRARFAEGTEGKQRAGRRAGEGRDAAGGRGERATGGGGRRDPLRTRLASDDDDSDSGFE